MSATGMHKHKHESAFVIGQLSHQSTTAPSRTTHAVDAVAAHTHVAEWQTIALDLNPVDYVIWSVIQFDAAGNILL